VAVPLPTQKPSTGERKVSDLHNGSKRTLTSGDCRKTSSAPTSSAPEAVVDAEDPSTLRVRDETGLPLLDNPARLPNTRRAPSFRILMSP
jgi:hypothetical protein